MRGGVEDAGLIRDRRSLAVRAPSPAISRTWRAAVERGAAKRYSWMVPSDTSPEMERILLQGYRRMTPAEKASRVEALNEGALQMAACRLARQYGPLSERELRLRLAALWLSRDTMVRVFGWDPDERGR